MLGQSSAVHAVGGSSQAGTGRPHALCCVFWSHVTLSTRTVRLVSCPAHEITVSDEKYCSCFCAFFPFSTVSIQQWLHSMQLPAGTLQALDQPCVCVQVCACMCVYAVALLWLNLQERLWVLWLLLARTSYLLVDHWSWRPPSLISASQQVFFSVWGFTIHSEGQQLHNSYHLCLLL